MHYPTRHPLPTLEDGIVAQLALSPATRSQLCEALAASAASQGIDVSGVRALAALEGAARGIGYGLGSAALLINPKAIILAGEIVDAFPSLRENIAAHMGAELLPVMEWDIDVVTASLGPLGAAQGCADIAAHPPAEEESDRERAPHRGEATASPGVEVCGEGECP